MSLVRISKFRHVYGSVGKKEETYEGLKIAKTSHDSSYCAVNPKFLAVVVETTGGGAFAVLPTQQTGRAPNIIPKVCGHVGPVTDIKWNPFNDNIIASSSEDTTIKIWTIPDGGLKTNLTDWTLNLQGHTKKVGYLEWHPTAEDILLSAGSDHKCIVWNLDAAVYIRTISVHTDTIFSIAWNRNGSRFATTCKDKRLRVIDPHKGTIVAQSEGHQGPKSSKVIFLDKKRLFTTGFSRLSERQYAIWDTDNLYKPLALESLDVSSGVLTPYYDFDTKVIFLAGKGDSNIRYFEIVEEAPYIHYLSQFLSNSPHRSLGLMPKRGVDVQKCEIVRFYKLHTLKDLIEPLSMIVPRKSQLFQEDIFPPTGGVRSSLTAEEWTGGLDRDPVLVPFKEILRTLHPTLVSSTRGKIGLDGSVSAMYQQHASGTVSERPSSVAETITKRPSSTAGSMHNLIHLSGAEFDLFLRERQLEEQKRLEALNTNFYIPHYQSQKYQQHEGRIFHPKRLDNQRLIALNNNYSLSEDNVLKAEEEALKSRKLKSMRKKS